VKKQDGGGYAGTGSAKKKRHFHLQTHVTYKIPRVFLHSPPIRPYSQGLDKKKTKRKNGR